MKNFTILFVLLICGIGLQAQIYVNGAAVGGNNDGSSWTDAYTTLHEALENYNADDEIWVAAGTYLPGQPSTWPDDPKNTFYIYQNASIYGGFNGTETMLTERDPATNLTILSGDLNGDDVVDDFETNRADNANNLIYIDTTSMAIIDGFTISGGHADGDTTQYYNDKGAAIFSWGVVELSSCIIEQNFTLGLAAVFMEGAAAEGSKIENSVFQKNKTETSAGAVLALFLRGEGITITGCQFLDNEAEFVAGALGLESNATISDCQFSQNTCNLRSGGAIYIQSTIESGYEMTITDCDFENNSAVYGGAFQFFSGESGNNNLTISGCEFRGNSVNSAQAGDFPDGGAIEFDFNEINDLPTNDTIIVVDCIVEDNSAERQGGGIAIYNLMGTDNYVEFNNCQISENTSGDAGGGFFLGNYGGTETKINFIGCDFTANSSNHGGASYYFSNTGSNNLSFSDCNFTDNNAITSTESFYPDGGALGFQYTSGSTTNDTITVENCLLENNTAERLGGGIAFFNSYGTDNHLEINNCQIIGNAAGSDSEGGGMAMFEGANTSSVLVRNTLFSNNTAEEVQAFFVGNFQGANIPQSRNVELVNCLLTDHNSNNFLSMVTAAQDAELTLTNCTFADNNCSAAALYAFSEDSKLTIQNTILQSGDYPNYFSLPGNANAEVLSLGGNLVSDASLDIWLNNTDQSNADPMFETGTYQLSENSPAIDAGIFIEGMETTDFAGNDRLQGGCIDIGAFESAYDAGTECLEIVAVEELVDDPSVLSVFPNPAIDVANFTIENEWQGKLYLRIVNTLGQTVYTAEFDKYTPSTVIEIDVSELPKGIYRAMVSGKSHSTLQNSMAISSFVKI